MAIHKQYVPRRNRAPVFILNAVVAIALLVVPVTRNGVRRGVGAAGTSILRGTHTISGWIGGIGSTLRLKSSLVAENSSLKTQITELGARLSERDELAQENQDLKATLGRAGSMKFTLAAVLAKPPESIYDTLVIDGGSSVGFTVGQVVYANGETPIGTIEEVLPSSAIVRLYSSSGEKTDARLGTSNIDITLVGHGGGTFSVQVPHDVVIPTGADALSKELDPHIIAVLDTSVADPRDSFQTLLFSSPVNMSELAFVQVAH